MDRISKGDDVSYKSHSTQINLSDCMSEKDFNFYLLQHKIPDEVVYRELPRVTAGPFQMLRDDPKEQYGYESVAHLTLLYGIKNEKDFFEMREMLKDFGPCSFKIGEVSSFRKGNNPYDVMIVKIVSDKLQDLHKKIKDNFKNDYKFPEYLPHITLAYVKKGTCKGLEGPSLWTGTEYTCTKIRFSHTDKYFLEIPLS